MIFMWSGIHTTNLTLGSARKHSLAKELASMLFIWRNVRKEEWRDGRKDKRSGKANARMLLSVTTVCKGNSVSL